MTRTTGRTTRASAAPTAEAMSATDVLERYQRYVMPTYTRTGLMLTKGKGMRVDDLQGQQYLDFFPGWGVSGLGHCHPAVVQAIRHQAGKLIHVANNFFHPLQAKLAERLIKLSFDGKVFFANSGAEANEGAVKLARQVGAPQGRYEIITMIDSFHGRTLAMVAATGQPKYQAGFAPLPEGFRSVPFNDLAAVAGAIGPKTIGVMLEVIQGEGGIHVATPAYLTGLRRLCDERGLLLMLDEVQTGLGRTGKLFAFQHYNITPDIMTLAKTLGGGFPIGALIARRAIADHLGPGTHAATFGGSPLACAASLAVLETIQRERLVTQAERQGAYLLAQLQRLQHAHPQSIREVRGMGLMVGMELHREGKTIVDRCRERRLLINCTQERVLRLLPALTVKVKQIDRAIGILDDVFRTLA